MNKFMKLAFDEADRTMRENYGGPFGACIVKDGEVIAVASNTVLKDHDPSAHAEINCIRKAGAKLGTHDLAGCTIYTTGYPCPMCLSAVLWSNISEVYYATTLDDCAKIGFRDEKFYDFLSGKQEGKISLTPLDREACLKLFENYQNLNKEIY